MTLAMIARCGRCSRTGEVDDLPATAFDVNATTDPSFPLQVTTGDYSCDGNPGPPCLSAIEPAASRAESATSFAPSDGPDDPVVTLKREGIGWWAFTSNAVAGRSSTSPVREQRPHGRSSPKSSGADRKNPPPPPGSYFLNLSAVKSQNPMKRPF